MRGGQGHRLFHQLVGGHHPVDQSQLEGPPGVDRIAGEGQLEGDGRGDPLGQADQAAGPGHQAPLDLGDPELGVLHGDHQVAARA